MQRPLLFSYQRCLLFVPPPPPIPPPRPRTACASQLRSKSHKIPKFVLRQQFRFPAISYLHQNKARYIAFHSCICLNNAPQTQLTTSFLLHTWALRLGISVPRGNDWGWVPIVGCYSGDVCWPFLLEFAFQRGKYKTEERRKKAPEMAITF